MNELLNPVVIAQDSLLRLENSLTFFKSVNREYDGQYAVPGNKIGYTYNARMPVRFRGRIGDAMQPEAIIETPVPIVVNRLWGQDMDISDQDLTMTIDRFGERYIEPAVETIGNNIDGEGLDLARDVYNFTGVPGTTPTSLTTYTAAGVVLANHAAPKGKMRAMIVSPEMEAGVLGFASNLFNPAKEISRQYEEGTMGYAVGFKWSMDQNVLRHTVGALGTTSVPLIDGANQTGASILTKGFATSVTVLNRGDIISIAGVNGVNPISYRDTGVKRTFVVTSDVLSTGGGAATIPIAPDINFDTTSPFQTVTALPADNAAVYVFNLTGSVALTTINGISTPQSLGFHRDAFTLVVARLEKPGGMEWSEEVSNPRIGLSVRLIRGYSIEKNRKYTRLDVLGGWKTLRPELACRVAG